VHNPENVVVIMLAGEALVRGWSNLGKQPKSFELGLWGHFQSGRATVTEQRTSGAISICITKPCDLKLCFIFMNIEIKQDNCHGLILE
jgi:hypothetical protein